MSLFVNIKNTKTGEIKSIKVGWSWILFLFSGFAGLPLFFRRLHVWGGFSFALWVFGIIGPQALSSQNDAIALLAVIFLTELGLSIYFGLNGNELTAKNYLENGWTFLDPDGEITKMAKAKWGIS
jgi:Na+-driven multidrug efflux pump